MARLPTSNRVFNRQSVQSAIRSTQQRLRLYNNKCPANGLAVFCGLATMDETNGKERLVIYDFEPLRPITSSFYRCDSSFHTEALRSFLVDEGADPYGFIVIDGNGALFGLVQGSSREILYKFSVSLPNKHGRGGQSAKRFERLRHEKRHNYMRKVAEHATHYFIADNNRPSVKGLIMAGQADCKDELQRSGLLDKRISSIVLKTIDISYGGERGFDQAIDQSMDTLGSVQLVQEKQVLERYFEEISQDRGQYCFSVRDTFLALDMGAVEDLILWEDLAFTRYTLQNKDSGEKTILYLSKAQEETELADMVNFDVVEKDDLVDWLCNNYKQNFGCNMTIVSDRSGLGTQFVRGFGGIGGTLRWQVDFAAINGYEQADDSFAETEWGDGNDDNADTHVSDDGGFSF